jgi:hypothetical protein
MRALYATHKQIRLFALGTPEGWHVGVYDLQNDKWTFDVAAQQTLKDAKVSAQQKAASLSGSRTPDLEWR